MASVLRQVGARLPDSLSFRWVIKFLNGARTCLTLQFPFRPGELDFLDGSGTRWAKLVDGEVPCLFVI